VVNGGARRVVAYTVLNNPARVQTPVIGKISKLSGRWSYRLHIVIPKVLQVVAGVPLVLQSLNLTWGEGTGWRQRTARRAATGSSTR
jgi:hypothetical protein